MAGKKLFFLCLVSTIYFVVPSSVSAATRTVSAGQSIQEAVNNSSAGDVITVLAGNYNERITITKSNLTLQAQGNVVTRGFKLIANSVTIKGFEIAFTSYSRWDTPVSAGIYLKGSNNLIEQNYIHDSALEGITLDATASNPTVTSNNIVRNNRLYHNEMVGINVNGRNNLIENNEVWGSVQCHPTVRAVEGDGCPLSGLDADGMRFFGQGHIFRGNKIHDIRLDEMINGIKVNFSPHIDCFQTWRDSSNETAANIIFEENYCENLNQGMYAFMLAGGANHLTIKNNVFKTYGGINTGGGADYLFIYNNVFANSLDYSAFAGAIGLENVSHAEIKNNIFFNQPYFTITVMGNTANIAIDYNLAFNQNSVTPRCILWGNYNTCQPTPNHNLWGQDPKFINSQQDDFHLQSDSPACTGGENGTYIGVFPCTEGSVKPGDANGDNKVDGVDYMIWLNHYNQNVTGATNGDFNTSGKVDGVDYVVWLNNYGK